MSNNLFVLAVLCLLVVLSEWLVRTTFMRVLGTALLVIVLTAVVANLGIIPAGSTEEQPVAAYDGIFTYLAPISIFWLLLRVNLRDILRAGIPIITLFLIGSLATTLGVLIGMWVIGAPDSVGEWYAALGGMFVGTYTGGSVNFNALALHYNIVREGVLYGSSVVVDNILTTIWMVSTLAIPKLLNSFWRIRRKKALTEQEPDLGIEEDTESMHPLDLGLILGLGIGALWLSEISAGLLASWGYVVPEIIIITLFALILAQLPVIQRIKGAQLLGIYSVYLFLAVIGAFCNLSALGEAGSLGISIFIFATIAILVHASILFGTAWLFRLDLQMAAVASQANVGGGTSALALARSLGRSDLVLPAVLIGSLGNAIGTFLGFWASEQLLPLLF